MSVLNTIFSFITPTFTRADSKWISPVLAAILLSACGLLGVQRASAPAVSTAALATFPDVEEAQLRSLIVAMRDLLNLSPDIARRQFARRLPPHNAAQDKRWMLIALQLGDVQRLPAEKTRRFMQAQVEAANFAKRGLFTLWEKEPSKLRLRPQIDTIAENQIGELIQSFARAQPALKIVGARAAIETLALIEMPNRNALSEPTRKLAMDPLLGMATP